MDILTTTLLILFGLLQLADMLTTLEVLERGGSEMNPLMQKAFAVLGPAGAFIVIKTALMAFVFLPTWYGMFAPYTWQVLAIFNAFYVAILINNALALHKLTKD